MFQAVESAGAARSPPFSAIALEQRSEYLIVWFENHSYLDDISQPLFLFPKQRPLGIGLVSGAHIYHSI